MTSPSPSNRSAVLSPPPENEYTDRNYRRLTADEKRVRSWIMENYGALSRIAREFGYSVQYVQRIAYNREARSKGLCVERRLKQLGCPLIQKVA